MAAACVVARPLAAQAQQGPAVFAAASLTDALRAIGEQWRAKGEPGPRFSFASSSALARQMEQGAPADIFASADEAWMDYVQQRNLIVEGTRSSLLGNTLVLVAPAGSPEPPLTLGRGTLLPERGRIATGDPAHVPAGKYAEAALRWMGQWEAVSARLARADNVRSALLLVERGEAPLGIVYGTDAAAARGVKVVAAFPEESHAPITYPFALTRRAAENPAARGFLAFVAGPEAAETWRRHGFMLRGQP